MIKKIFSIILCGILLFGIAGCKFTNNFDIGGVSDITINDNSNVTLSIKDKTLKNTGVTLILENDSDKLLRYDEYYKMEIKKDKEWHAINVELYFDDPLWGVKQNSKEEFELNWEYGYGRLAPGEYRIIKKVYFETDTSEEEPFYVSTEFMIN